jgi:hypothetical protein
LATPPRQKTDTTDVLFPGAGHPIRVTRHVTFDELWRARIEYYRAINTEFPDSPYPAPAPPPSPDPAPPPPASAAPPVTVQLHGQASPPLAQPPPPALPPPDRPPLLPPASPLPQHIFTPPPALPPRPPGSNVPVLPPAVTHNDSQPPRARRSIALPPSARRVSPRNHVPQPTVTPAPTGYTFINTNLTNSLSDPVTPETDSLDIQSISHRTSHPTTGIFRYRTKWEPSYNITQPAIDHRLRGPADSGSSWQLETKVPSVHNPSNYDVTWASTLEPKSSFLTDDGLMEIFTQFENDHGNRVLSSVPEEPDHTDNPRAAAFLSLARNVSVVCPILPHPDAFLSSPTNVSYANPGLKATAYIVDSPLLQDHSPAADTTFFTRVVAGSPNADKIAYAFLDVILPSGSTPVKLNAALRSVDRRHWKFALDKEVHDLQLAETWTLVPRNTAPNVISGKWVFKIKHNSDGSIDRYKARWVARGFSQKQDVDYTEIFAPVVRLSSLRTLLSLSNAMSLRLYGLDVSNAFARADVDEDIYVEQPHGYVETASDNIPLVCKLNRGLYGTKQAARLWNQKFRKFIVQEGWSQYESDPCIYSRYTRKFGTEFIGVYVDDIAHACSHISAHTALHAECNKHFPTTSQGELTWILGMEIKRDFHNKILTINQTQAILTFLEACDAREGCKQRNTPMDEQWTYGDSPVITDPARQTLYRSRCGSIAYFAQCTRPDISYAINRLCRHLNNPNDACFRALNHLIGYLAKFPHLGIHYHSHDPSTLRLEAYTDAGHGGSDIDCARSQSGYIVYFGGGPIDWSSTLQSIIAQSSAEAEQVAAFNASRAIMYFRQLLEEFGHKQSQATILWEDNQACIAQSKNPVNHKRCKHILLKYHYLRDLTESGIVKLEYISTTDQIADIFTKAVPPRIFAQLVPFLVRPI